MLASDATTQADRHPEHPADAPVMTVYRSLAAVEPVWRALAEALPCYVFQTFEWISLWYRTMGEAEGIQPFVVCLSDGHGQPRALFPLGLRSRLGCRILTFLGGDVTDYNAPLCDRRMALLWHREGFRDIWHRIVRLSRADLVWLQRMPAMLPDGPDPMVAEAHARHTDIACAAAPLPASFAAFAAERSAAFFRDTRRRRRRMEQLGAVTLEVPAPGPDSAAAVELMLRQKRRRIADSGARPMSPAQERFYRALAAARLPDGAPHVARLVVGGETVATHLGVLHRRCFYWLMPGYETGKWAPYSAGRVLLQSLVEWCIERGIERFDLTVGDEEYKRFWANLRMSLYESRYPQTFRGACFLAAQRLRTSIDARPRGAGQAGRTSGEPEGPGEPFNR